MKTKNLKMTLKNSGNDGFSIIEVLIGLAIFSIGFLAVASMQITAVNLNSGSKFRTEATTLALDKVEELLALPYTSAGLQAVPVTPRVPEHISRYSRTYTVTDNTPMTYTKTIQVRVDWPEGGRIRNVTLDFIKADL